MSGTDYSTPPSALCRPQSFIATTEEVALGNVSFYDLAEHFSARPDFVLLDSRGDDDNLGTFSFLSFSPFSRLTTKDGATTLRIGQRERTSIEDPFAVLQHLLERWCVPPVEDALAIPFRGGAIGCLSYELGRQLEVLPQTAVDELGLPNAYLSFYNFAIALHCATGRMYLCHLESQGEPLGLSRESIYAELRQARPGAYEKSQLPHIICSPANAFTPDLTKAAYLDAVHRIKEYIYTGDVYQVNMTQRFRAPAENASAWSIYKQLAAINPAPFAAYLNCDGYSVVSSSPERFLRVHHREVETRPIKGTIRRGVTPEEDMNNRLALFSSTKDRAELAMIVDLMRNDVGRVCTPGSVRVRLFPQLETYSSVHHLVATVTGELAEGAGVVDVIKATFPGGSISGAPKIRAMEIIDELEPVTRGVYTGSIGYLGFDGQVDLNIAIRTIIFKDDVAYVHAGGGIVADSDEREEYEESMLKATRLFQAVQLATTAANAASMPHDRTYADQHNDSRHLRFLP